MITEIGKIRISWRGASGIIRQRLASHYRDFTVSDKGSCDIKLKIEKQNGLLVRPKKYSAIISAGSWDYFKNENKSFFHFPREDAGSIAEISSGSKSVKFSTFDKSGQLLLYLFPELLYSLILPELGGILLHACGIKIGGKIFVFMAPSEGGKSTIAKLAIENGSTILNDDRIILRKINNKYIAFGNPWHGEVEIASSESGEISNLFILKKSNRNYLHQISKKELFLEILKNSFYLKEDREHFEGVITAISDMANCVRGYVLGFKPDKKIWRYLDEKFR